jgi:hypothetical protein
MEADEEIRIIEAKVQELYKQNEISLTSDKSRTRRQRSLSSSVAPKASILTLYILHSTH